MSTPDSFPRPSAATRWGLPALAVLIILGVIIAVTLFQGGYPPAVKNPPLVQEQRQADPGSANTSTAVVVTVVPAPALPPAATEHPTAQAVAKAAPVDTPPSPPAFAPVHSNAKESVSLTDPQAANQPLAPGEPAKARVSVGGLRTPFLVPNQVGSFPRVYLPLGGQADVQMQLPDAAPGDQVVAAVEDGGHFADGKPVQAFTLDENREIAFQFQASQSLGIFRVSVRHAAQTKIVTFWAGDRARAFNY